MAPGADGGRDEQILRTLALKRLWHRALVPACGRPLVPRARVPMMCRMGQQLVLDPSVVRALRESQSDAELASAAASGDREAFDVLGRRHRERVLAVCRKVLKDEGEAEEAAQEALLAAFQHLERFEGRSAFTTWLHTIALNCARMRLRKKRPNPTGDAMERAHTRSTLASEPPLRPDQAYLAREHGRAAARALETLDDDSRHALVGRFLERPLTELAQEKGISVGGIKTRIFRARAELKHQLAAAGLGTTLDERPDLA